MLNDSLSLSVYATLIRDRKSTFKCLFFYKFNHILIAGFTHTLNYMYTLSLFVSYCLQWLYVDYFDLDSLWTAPELLANPYYSPKGTKEGDVYSFSIILHEIIYRMGSFAGHGFLNYEGLWKQFFSLK